MLLKLSSYINQSCVAGSISLRAASRETARWNLQVQVHQPGIKSSSRLDVRNITTKVVGQLALINVALKVGYQRIDQSWKVLGDIGK
ncbi:hypothetical protein ACG10_14595 [Azotobacter chroococcum]|nr:hypothetical protein ACG10_14595 [Azotobacter chroococcum]